MKVLSASFGNKLLFFSSHLPLLRVVFLTSVNSCGPAPLVWPEIEPSLFWGLAKVLNPRVRDVLAALT